MGILCSALAVLSAVSRDKKPSVTALLGASSIDDVMIGSLPLIKSVKANF